MKKSRWKNLVTQPKIDRKQYHLCIICIFFPSMFIFAKYFPLSWAFFFSLHNQTEREKKRKIAKENEDEERKKQNNFHRHKQSGVLKLIPSNIFIDLVERKKKMQPSVWENCSSCVRRFSLDFSSFKQRRENNWYQDWIVIVG